MKLSDLTLQILHGLSDLRVWILYLVSLIYNHSKPVNAAWGGKVQFRQLMYITALLLLVLFINLDGINLSSKVMEIMASS